MSQSFYSPQHNNTKKLHSVELPCSIFRLSSTLKICLLGSHPQPDPDVGNPWVYNPKIVAPMLSPTVGTLQLMIKDPNLQVDGRSLEDVEHGGDHRTLRKAHEGKESLREGLGRLQLAIASYNLQSL